MGAHSGRIQGHNHVKRSNSHSKPHRTPLESTDGSTHEYEPSELSDADYKYLEESTRMSRTELKKIYHNYMRESVNGELDLDGFVEFYRSLTLDDSPAFLDENPQFIFDTFDKDHSGRVSFREFMSAYVLTSPGNLEKKLEYTFELYDMDNDGFLDLDEIYRYSDFFE